MSADVGEVVPIWADPVALAAETEADRLAERRLWWGLVAAMTVVVALYLLRVAVTG